MVTMVVICCFIASLIAAVTRRYCASLTRRRMRRVQFDHASSNKIRLPSSALRCSEEWSA